MGLCQGESLARSDQYYIVQQHNVKADFNIRLRLQQHIASDKHNVRVH